MIGPPVFSNVVQSWEESFFFSDSFVIFVCIAGKMKEKNSCYICYQGT